jgi:hypothetical protein
MKRKATGKRKAVRTTRIGKRAATTSHARRASIRGRHDDFIDSLVTASAQALGLTIDPAWRDSVKFNLRLVLDHAARVEALPLPDDAEPASVFHA